MLPSTRPLIICCRKMSIRGSPGLERHPPPSVARGSLDRGIGCRRPAATGDARGRHEQASQEPGHRRPAGRHRRQDPATPVRWRILGAPCRGSGRTYPRETERATIQRRDARALFVWRRFDPRCAAEVWLAGRANMRAAGSSISRERAPPRCHPARSEAETQDPPRGRHLGRRGSCDCAQDDGPWQAPGTRPRRGTAFTPWPRRPAPARPPASRRS